MTHTQSGITVWNLETDVVHYTRHPIAFLYSTYVWDLLVETEYIAECYSRVEHVKQRYFCLKKNYVKLKPKNAVNEENSSSFYCIFHSDKWKHFFMESFQKPFRKNEQTFAHNFRKIIRIVSNLFYNKNWPSEPDSRQQTYALQI